MFRDPSSILWLRNKVDEHMIINATVIKWIQETISMENLRDVCRHGKDYEMDDGMLLKD